MATDPAETAGVAFLGPLGTYSHQAALQFSANHAVTLYAKHSIQETVDAGKSRRADPTERTVIVVPFINSVQGGVLETFACLADPNFFGPDALKIVDEVDLTIAHALIVRRGAGVPADDLSTIRVVRSHPQALGQCSDFLSSRLPHAQLEEAQSTADAVSLLRADDNSAAVASELSAELLDASVLFRGIQNSNGKFT